MKTKKLCVYLCVLLMVPLLSAAVSANSPPTAPEIEGTAKGKPGVQYTYGFCSTDPDGDAITICINWGDGSGEVCIGPIPSGTCATANHIWTAQGTYIVKAKASDGQAESAWSELSVTMPRTISNHILMQRLLSLFPNAFPVLRQLLKL